MAALGSIMEQISQTYQNHRLYFNVAGAMVVFFLIFFDVLQTLLMNLITLVYLGYRTMELLNEDEPETDMMKSLLKKWSTYATFLGFEIIANMVMFWPLSWVYPFGKMMIYLWVVNDASNAATIYDDYIKPLYTRHRPLIVKVMNILDAVAQKIGVRVNELLTDLTDILKTHEVLGSLVNAISFGTLSGVLDAAHNAVVAEKEEESKED